MAAGKMMTAREWGLLLALSLLWGGSFFFVGIAVRDIPPLTIVALRVGLAAIALAALLSAFRIALPTSPHLWAAFFVMGLLNNAIPFCLIVWSQTRIASGLAAILNATTPLFAVLVAHFLTKDEKITAARLIGVVTGFAGVTVMIGQAMPEGAPSARLAELAVLGAALSYSLAGIYGRRFKALGVAPMAAATGQVTASALMLAPVAAIVEQPWTLPLPGWPSLAAIASIALLSTALAYALFFRILASAGATNLMLVTFLIPVSAILLGSLVLGEHLEGRHFAGMVLIATGLAAIDGRLPARLFGRRKGKE